MYRSNESYCCDTICTQNIIKQCFTSINAKISSTLALKAEILKMNNWRLKDVELYNVKKNFILTTIHTVLPKESPKCLVNLIFWREFDDIQLNFRFGLQRGCAKARLWLTLIRPRPFLARVIFNISHQTSSNSVKLFNCFTHLSIALHVPPVRVVSYTQIYLQLVYFYFMNLSLFNLIYNYLL